MNDWKNKDGRRLYTTCSGWPELPVRDYHVVHERDHTPYRLHGGPLGPNSIFDYRDVLEGSGAPVIAHELGQWCVYPNFDEMAKYTGVLKPKNFEIFRDFLEANHMGDQARAFLLASGKLQALCYKEEIESALRTPGFGGFHLLDLHDFPGQGTALVGVLDPFWDEKGLSLIHISEPTRPY